MSDLTDLDICKKIAEIECSFSEVHRDRNGGYVVTNTTRDYNPLTDDALCFQLMFKYGVCIHYESGDAFICGGDNFDGCLSVKSFDVGDDESLKKAICLVIIEANSND